MITFQELGLNPMIMQALTELGFENPTPVQSKTIPHLINSKQDLIALAQTGTGKTAAFSLPIIQQLDDVSDNADRSVQCLILCPTRELAIQIASDIKNYIKYLKNFKVAAVYGGERVDVQIGALKKMPQIVVGTPGRVNDLIRRRLLKVGGIKWLVLDEADEMLNMGFKEELDDILKNTPEEKQVLLFSATMNQQIRRIADNYMKKPEEITVGNKNMGADNVEHCYYVVHERDRYQALRRIADVNPNIHGIVFCRTRRETQQVADKLIQDHYSAEAIHGDISQDQRTAVMNRFRDKQIQLLVATDVAARGIDVKQLTHVINYNLPDSEGAYVHRSGRTGRANNVGISLVIVNMREQYKIKGLERRIGKSFEKAQIPSGDDICERQLFKLVDKICNVEVNESQIDKYLPLIAKKFEHLDREALIKKFVSEEFNRFLEHYQGSIDLNSGVSRDQGRGSERNSGGQTQRFNKSSILYARFNITIGRNDGFSVRDLFGFMNQQPEIKGVEIGNIDLKNGYTLFEVDERYKDKVMSSFKGANVNGINVDITCEETGVESTRMSGGRGAGRSGPRNSGPGGRGRFSHRGASGEARRHSHPPKNNDRGRGRKRY